MKKNFIFIVLILALIITTGTSIITRAQVEKNAKTIEVTVSYDDMTKMAEQSNQDISVWLKQFRSYGVYSAALEEETFQSLVDSGHALQLEVLKNIKKDILWESRYPASFVDYIHNGFDKNDVVVVSEDQSLKHFIIAGLKEHYPESFYTIFEDGKKYAILLDGTEEELRYTQLYASVDHTGKPIKQHQDVVGSALYYYGIAFDGDKIQIIKNSGLDVILRPWNNVRFTEKLLTAYKNNLNRYDLTSRVMIFAGKEVLGYPDHLKDLNDYMDENNITPALIETTVQRSNTDQSGLMGITENLDYQSVRVLPIVGYIQERFQAYNYSGGEEIENTIFRAVTERNIRLIYFRPYMYNSTIYVTDTEEYKLSFERLDQRLDDHKMSFGQLSLMPFNGDNMISAMLIGMGLISLVILAARFFFRLPILIEYLLLLFGSVAIFGALYVAPNLGRQLLALTASVTVSSVGAVLMVEFARDRFIDKQVFRTREILLKSILMTLGFGLFAMFGGLIVGALLSHSQYLLEINFFRGVKISEMLPLMVFVLLYLLKFGYNRSSEEIKLKEIMPKDLWRFINIQVKLSYLLIAAIVGGVLFIYIARSGHETTVQPSNIEMIFRNFLELKLLARPRLKEFLMAIPAMMMFIYIGYKAYKPLIALVGIPAMITFTSIINTFCHLRTPVYLSVIRTLFSIGFGIIIGSVLIVLCDLLERFIKRLLKYKLSYQTDEKKELGA